jgi:HD-GYP domain-containing protein (c-di-GMP phosphodiesterase class II)
MKTLRPAALPVSPTTSQPGEAAPLAACLDLLRDENEALGRELLRCYEQLNLLFEITENISALRDPDLIQKALLQRFGGMLGAGAVYVDHGGRCTAVEMTQSFGQRLPIEPDHVRRALIHEIELVRRTERAWVPTCEPATRDALNDAHVLLAALRQFDTEAAVAIVLRHRSEPAFDSGDVLATESVLGYGGHILANVLMVRHLQQLAVGTVCALANAIDAKDEYTCGHSERVGFLARLTGVALGLPEPQLQLLEWAGLLHDVGKIGISDQILKKPSRLTEAEFAEIRRHPRLSYEVLKPVTRLGPVLVAVLYHHENWDGSGYPEKLRGEQIPVFARIIRVADTFDALTSTRLYRKGFPIEEAVKILQSEIGRSLEQHVAQMFIKALDEYMRERPQDFHTRFAHVIAGGAKPDRPSGAETTGFHAEPTVALEAGGAKP